MRRKSHRNAAKASPEKPVEVPTRRSRRHSKRRKKSSSQSSSDDSDDVSLKIVAQQAAEASTVEKPVLTAEENPEQPIWKVTPTQPPPSGEIQKLKICLTRPVSSSPEKNERTSRRCRNKSGSNVDEDITSSEEKNPRKSRHRGSPGVNVEEQEEETDEQEDKKGKGKSKTKHKSKSEKTPQIQEVEDQTQSEISENVQVTPQSPQAAIDIRVDNESMSTIEHETVTTDETETCSIPQNVNTSEICDVTSGNVTEQIPDKPSEKNHEHDTLPQSPLPEPISDKTKRSDSPDSQENFRGFSIPEQNIEIPQIKENVENETTVQEEVEPELKIEESVQIIQSDQETAVELSTKETSDQTEDHKSAEVQDTNIEIPNVEAADVEVATVEQQDVNSEIQTSPAKVCELEHKEDERMIVEEYQITDDKVEEEHTNEVTESKPESCELTTHESKCNITSPEESEQVHHEQVASPIPNKESLEEIAESQTSPIHNKEMIIEESNSKSIDEAHRSDEDSRSVDGIILDNSCTPSKEDTSFNLMQSFSPDVRQIEEVNKQLQDMKNEVSELFPSPIKIHRKSKWGISSAGLELIKPTLNKINIDTIKEFCPELRFLDENEIKIDIRENKDRRKSYSLEQKERRTDRKVSIEYKSDDPDQRRLETQSSVNSSEMEEAPEPDVIDNSNIIAMNRKISIVDDTASKMKPPPSPAKNPVSEVLYITNLVRPFTLKQLKELLERTGKIIENGFWTDRIKSKCYVHYETVEEAEATRNALHGVHWPIGNGKKLIIDYATQEDIEKARNPTPPPPPVIPEPKIPEKEPEETEQIPVKRSRTEENDKTVVKEREKLRNEGHVREWDIGKENMHKLRSHSRERDVRNDRNERRRHRRTPSPVDDFISRKQRKKEEDIPQKLMDDLFRKTKATPSIYWLPLTPEEIATKQQQRLLRMAEHKRRMEESSRSRGDYGRGAAYRRRYE